MWSQRRGPEAGVRRGVSGDMNWREAEGRPFGRLRLDGEVCGDCGYRFVVKTFPLGVDLLKAFFAVGVVFKEIDALRVARGYFPDFCAFATGHEGEPYIVGCGR